MASSHMKQKVAAVDLTRPNPEAAAAISKLVMPRETPFRQLGDGKNISNLESGRMAEISDSINNRITDAENIMQLFPDLALAAQILESSILSPKDMLNPVLNYSSDTEDISTEIVAQMTKCISKHMESFYSLSKELSVILHDMMFVSGSYMSLVIPESSLDEFINSGRNISVESLSTSGLFTPDAKQLAGLGILGEATAVNNATTNTVSAALESIIARTTATSTTAAIEGFNNLVEVTDNYGVLKLPRIISANNKAKLKNIINPTHEYATEDFSFSTVDSNKMASSMYKGANVAAKPFAEVKSQDTLKRRSIGRPLSMHVPSESVIPVHVPGDERKHIGYFILVDMEGNPLTKSSNAQYLSSMSQQPMNAQSDIQSTLIAKAKNNLVGREGKNLPLDQLASIYGELIENDLMLRLKNGLYGSKVAITKDREVYRIMLARTLANQYTRLVYIPEELATYFAFQYYKNGTGKSLLDDLKVLTSLRAILLFSKTMQMTKNAIATTHVNMTLNPNDPDPQETIEVAIHEVIKLRQQTFPLGINQPVDLVNWIHRAGLEFSFEGHPGIPDTKLDFETKNLQQQVPDTEFDEFLRKQTFMAVGLNPETIDAGFGSDFAASVITNNVLRSRRIMQYQESLSEQVSTHVRKIIHADYTIRDELFGILKENKGSLEKYLDDDTKALLEADPRAAIDNIINEFADSISVSLPKPDIATIESQNEAFTAYSDAIDKGLDAWISSAIVDSSIAGDISSNVDAIKAVLKAYFQRDWMTKNGYLLELSDITTADKDGNPNIDIMNVTKEHTESLMRTVVKFIESMKAMKDAANTDLANMGTEPGQPSEASPEEDSTGSDDFGLGSGDDLGGDLGLGGEVPGENTPEDKEEPVNGADNPDTAEPDKEPGTES